MGRLLHALAIAGAVALGGCGGSASRYDPGLPSVPAGLTAAGGNGQVALSWQPVPNAAEYAVYLSTSPGVTRGSGTKGPSVTGTSAAVAGLANGTRYHFVVTAINSRGESAESNEAEATPAAPASFSQADLAGTWRFAVLSAGADAGWARGTIAVDPSGQVTVLAGASILPYADSGGEPAPRGPGLFPVLLVDAATGRVRNAGDPSASTLDAVLGATHRNLVVGTSASNGTASLAVLLKHDPAVAFAAGSGSGTDISGWGGGGAGGGARKVVYDQVSAGAAPQEWEFAAGQIGQTPSIQYATSGGTTALTYLAPSSPPRPTNKTTSFTIDANGIVTEAVTGVSTDTRPVFLVDHGFMSDDRTLIVAAGLAASPSAPPGATAAGRHALRIYHVTNVHSTASASDTATGAQADLAGAWSFRRLAVGSSPASAAGTLVVDGAGAVSFTSYADTAGSAAPVGMVLTMMPDSLDLPGVTQFWGTVNGGSDPTLHGKLSYGKDLLVVTRTEPGGGASFTIALR